MYRPELVTWTNPDIQYLFGREIIEYDIKSAGLSITEAYKLAPEDLIRQWRTLPKDQRSVKMGIYRGNNQQYSRLLTQKFAEVRKFFLNMNSLTDDDIIAVKNDAIFTIGRQSHLKLGPIEFRAKNVYQSYIRFFEKLEVFFKDGDVDIKGMGVSAVNSHRLYLISFLMEMTERIERRDKFAVRKCIRFIDEFKTGELEEPYYLEFNSRSRQRDPLQVYRDVLIPVLQIALRECQ